MRRTIAALVVAAVLAGCAFVPFRHHHAAAKRDRSSPGAASLGECRIDLLKVLIGRPGSAVLAAQALDLSGARIVRWMHPGDVATMDLVPDRLDIKLTRANIVKAFACG